jgi:hypothetical protein
MGRGNEKRWRKAVDEHSAVSDLSESTRSGTIDEDEADYENFEKTLRAKHSKACKAMSVSRTESTLSILIAK